MAGLSGLNLLLHIVYHGGADMLGGPQLARLGLSGEYESGLPIAAVAFRGLDDI